METFIIQLKVYAKEQHWLKDVLAQYHQNLLCFTIYSRPAPPPPTTKKKELKKKYFFSLSVYYTTVFYVHFEGTWILNLHYYYVKFLHLQSLT